MSNKWWSCKCGGVSAHNLRKCVRCSAPRIGIIHRLGKKKRDHAGRVMANLRGTLATTLRKRGKADGKNKLQHFLTTVALPRQQKLAHIARDESMLDAAKYELVSGFFSARTLSSYSSEVALYESLMKNCGVQPWPLTAESIETFGAVLKAGEYAVNPYLTAIASTNALMGHEVDPNTSRVMSWVRKSAKRASPEFAVAPVLMTDLDSVNLQVEKPSPFTCMVGRLAVLGFVFLLRADELLHLEGWCQCTTRECECPAHVRIRGDRVTIKLCGDKTNQEGRVLVRTAKCCCDGARMHDAVPLCPVCAAKAMLRDAPRKGKRLQRRFISQGTKTSQLKYHGFLTELRHILRRAGCKMRENGKQRYGTHSLRRGGAQAMALCGISLDLIKLWGRWRSDVIARYVHETPLAHADMSQMMRSWHAETESGQVIAPRGLKRGMRVLVEGPEGSSVLGILAKSRKGTNSWEVAVSPAAEIGPTVVMQCDRKQMLLIGEA